MTGTLSFTPEGVKLDGEAIPTNGADGYLVELAEWCAQTILALAQALGAEVSSKPPQPPHAAHPRQCQAMPSPALLELERPRDRGQRRHGHHADPRQR